LSRLLIVGGSDAGISAALRAREIDPGVEVTVLLADRYPNFSICGLPYFLSSEVPDWHALAHRTLDELEQTGIELLLEHTAERIDPNARTVTVRTDRGRQQLRYETLIVATGAEPVRPRVPGIERERVYQLHTIGDSLVLDAALARRPERAAIVGAGYIA
jgi:NADPH-dependent 2,4-dienoyl-CoA reductase/sulfur reductase-like enzyme